MGDYPMNEHQTDFSGSLSSSSSLFTKQGLATLNSITAVCEETLDIEKSSCEFIKMSQRSNIRTF